MVDAGADKAGVDALLGRGVTMTIFPLSLLPGREPEPDSGDRGL
jgi:hypothetical protein